MFAADELEFPDLFKSNNVNSVTYNAIKEFRR